MSPTTYVILYRNPGNGSVGAVMNDADNIAKFPTEELAQQAAHNTIVCQAWPYSIVEAP